MGGLLHLVQLYNGPLLCGFNVPFKGLSEDDQITEEKRMDTLPFY